MRGAMAPQMWLLRHGEAVPHESKPDDERELTARGERQALAAGEALARLGVDARLPAYEGRPEDYVAALQAASDAAELLDPARFGGFWWLVREIGTGPVLAPDAGGR